jgi:hypothetical protein
MLKVRLASALIMITYLGTVIFKSKYINKQWQSEGKLPRRSWRITGL